MFTQMIACIVEFNYLLYLRVYDQPSSDLLRHWEVTYQFICEAR